MTTAGHQRQKVHRFPLSSPQPWPPLQDGYLPAGADPGSYCNANLRTGLLCASAR